MLSTSLNSQDPTVESSLGELYDIIGELNSLVFGTNCPTQYDITNQIPLWVIVEKEDRISNGISGLSLFDFVQKYYDWLYCDQENGAQYELNKRLVDIIDIDKTRSVFLQRLANIYASGFDLNSLKVNGGIVEDQNLRNLLRGIRRSFYHKKTTEDGIKYFFQTIYGIDEEDIEIQVPKKYILRLNGGRFFDEKVEFVSQGATSYESANFLTSYLNGSRLQDGNWIQDWSYLIKTGVAAYYYRNSFVDMAHPAGMKVVYERTLADYKGPTFDDTVPSVCDSAFLRNYAAYGISFNYFGFTSGITYAYPAYWGNIKGLTLIGLPRNTGCCGTSYSGFTGKTNLFPNWSGQYSTTNFKDLNIETMFQLCFPQLDVAGSPNSGFTGSCS